MANRRLTGQQTEQEIKKAAESKEAQEDLCFVMLVMLVVVIFVAIIMVSPVRPCDSAPRSILTGQFGFAWYFGARFDLAWQELKQGNFLPDKNAVHRDREL